MYALKKVSNQSAKEATINQIKKLIPDTLYEIKSFAFNDPRKVHNIKMAAIVNRFKNALVSRAVPGNYFEDPDNEEHWCICLSSEESDEKQFQTINCKICGNFIVSDTWGNMIDDQTIVSLLLIGDEYLYTRQRNKILRNITPQRLRCECNHS